MYTIRDRQSRPGITSGVTKDVSTEDWPFVIDAPSPPFGFGKVVALVTAENWQNGLFGCLMKKKNDCEFRDRCIKDHQNAGEMRKNARLKVLGDERTRGHVCAWIMCGTVLACSRWKRYFKQKIELEGEPNVI